MTLYFITGNKNKFVEVQKMLEPIKIEQLDLDLDEIQSMNPKEIIQYKLNIAKSKHKGEFIVDDTSLCLDALNGFPGPLIKWFLLTVGKEKIYQIAEKLGNTKASAKVIIGYTDGQEVLFFEGTINGNLVAPKVGSPFGWDPIFQPEGFSQTFAEMTKEEKNKISHRGKAVSAFLEYYKHKK